MWAWPEQMKGNRCTTGRQHGRWRGCDGRGKANHSEERGRGKRRSHDSVVSKGELWRRSMRTHPLKLCEFLIVENREKFPHEIYKL